MSDTVKAWIEERRAIHAESTDGPWVAEYSAETGDCVIPHDAQSTREAVAVTRLFHRTADANAIADAHNMFPRALDALNAVLKVLDDPGGPNSWSHTFQGRHSVFADDVRAAIEGAIND